MANKNRSAQRERFWRGVLARFARSGQQVREFCRENRLSEPSFYAWRRTLAERDREAAEKQPRLARESNSPCHSPKPPAFLPVVMRHDSLSSPAPWGISIELRGGRTLRLPESIPAERVAAICAALESHATTEARS